MLYKRLYGGKMLFVSPESKRSHTLKLCIHLKSIGFIFNLIGIEKNVTHIRSHGFTML